MLYTRRGDNGTTKDFNSKPGERKSKASCQTESLGALDELNSFLGLVKVKSVGLSWKIDGKKVDDIVGWIQNSLFSVQAEVAGADKRVGAQKTEEMEKYINLMEAELPPIRSFFISGGTELAALFDISRTLARHAERRVVAAVESDEVKLDQATLAFMNRLSSLLYAFARLTNHKSGIKESAPTY